MAVRDREWRTIPLEIVKEELTPDLITFTARHRGGEVDFQWLGSFRISDDQIEFTMDGEALASFGKNRIGWCVLHPAKECAGQPCTVGHPDGTSTKLEFPKRIAPQQPFLNIRSMTHEVVPGWAAQVSFEGDIFETEDHRNWADDSFKTYSTPQSEPRPVELPQGAKIRQRVVLKLAPVLHKWPKIRVWEGTTPGPAFVDLNRSRIVFETSDVVRYSATPQSHASDESTIWENLPALAAMVCEAKALSGDKPVALDPLLFSSRREQDSRVDQPFATAWLTGALAQLVSAGVDEIAVEPMASDLLARIAAFGPESGGLHHYSLESVGLILQKGDERRVITARRDGSLLES